MPKRKGVMPTSASEGQAAVVKLSSRTVCKTKPTKLPTNSPKQFSSRERDRHLCVVGSTCEMSACPGVAGNVCSWQVGTQVCRGKVRCLPEEGQGSEGQAASHKCIATRHKWGGRWGRGWKEGHALLPCPWELSLLLPGGQRCVGSTVQIACSRRPVCPLPGMSHPCLSHPMGRECLFKPHKPGLNVHGGTQFGVKGVWGQVQSANEMRVQV